MHMLKMYMLEILILTESDFSVYILCQNEYKDTVNYFCEYIVFFSQKGIFRINKIFGMVTVWI